VQFADSGLAWREFWHRYRRSVAGFRHHRSCNADQALAETAFAAGEIELPHCDETFVVALSAQLRQRVWTRWRQASSVRATDRKCNRMKASISLKSSLKSRAAAGGTACYVAI